MHLFLVGVSHKTAPVDLRERLTFEAGEVGDALRALATKAGLYEAVLLSTCNRTEVYGTGLSSHAHQRMLEALAARCGEDPGAIEPHIVCARDGEAVRHLCRVAAGLDSLVMGEPQILGQVRGAYELARAAHMTGARLSKLFHTAIEAGKTVRSQTSLGSTPVSIATIALQLGRRLLDDLAGLSILIVGAGEMCETAAVLAAERHPSRLVIVNRTFEHAEALARLSGGEARPWSSLRDEVRRADLLLTGTGAMEPVIDQDTLGRAVASAPGRRIVVVDMGVPRDVEPSASCLDGVFLYGIDDLELIAEEHLAQRRSEIPRAESIVDRAVERYMTWLESLAVVPTIVDLRARAEQIRKAEVDQHLHKLQDLDDRGRHRVEQLTQAIVNKLLHEPSVRLKGRATDDTGLALAESLRYLFALDDVEQEP